MKSFFVRLWNFLLGPTSGCPICGKRLAMQAPIVHVCREDQ